MRFCGAQHCKNIQNEPLENALGKRSYRIAEKIIFSPWKRLKKFCEGLFDEIAAESFKVTNSYRFSSVDESSSVIEHQESSSSIKSHRILTHSELIIYLHISSRLFLNPQKTFSIHVIRWYYWLIDIISRSFCLFLVCDR